MRNLAEIAKDFARKPAKAGLGITGGFALSVAACGGNNESSTPDDMISPTPIVEMTNTPMPSETAGITPILTEAPTNPPETISPPEPTPEAWSDESISVELDRATGLTYILSLRLYPDSIELKTASTEAQTALQEYQTAHESGDYSSIQGTIDKFANVGRTMLNLACYDAYAEVKGSNYIHYRDLVKNLGSRYEHEGYLEAGTTESLMQSLAAPADCTNETILASNN